MAEKGQQVSHQDAQTSGDGTGDITAAFRADLLGERGESAAEAGVWESKGCRAARGCLS